MPIGSNPSCRGSASLRPALTRAAARRARPRLVQRAWTSERVGARPRASGSVAPPIRTPPCGVNTMRPKPTGSPSKRRGSRRRGRSPRASPGVARLARRAPAPPRARSNTAQSISSAWSISSSSRRGVPGRGGSPRGGSASVSERHLGRVVGLEAELEQPLGERARASRARRSTSVRLSTPRGRERARSTSSTAASTSLEPQAVQPTPCARRGRTRTRRRRPIAARARPRQPQPGLLGELERASSRTLRHGTLHADEARRRRR